MLSRYIHIPGILLIISFFIVITMQEKVNLINVLPLKGGIVPASDTSLTKRGWFDCSYQDQKEKYVNENFGFRNIFVRLHNQVQYSLYKKATANQVVVGKQNYLYELNYIRAVNGSDFIGKEKITQNVQRLQTLRDSLKNHGVDLLIVFAPGKGSFFPEFIPDRYNKPGKITNYQVYRDEFHSSKIPFIDFNSWFCNTKSTSKYPLYPQTGVHWSNYGVWLCVDSLCHYLEKLEGMDLPDIHWKAIKTSSNLLYNDQDIEDGMNLLFSIDKYPLAYPECEINYSGKVKLPLLTISDSYYWPIFGTGIASKFFDPNEFWYYFERAYYDGKEEKTVASLDTRAIVESNKVVMLLVTEANLPRFDFGFSKSLLEIYTNPYSKKEFEALIAEKIISIRNSPDWFASVKKKADEKHLPLDSMIYRDALWVIQHEIDAKDKK